MIKKITLVVATVVVVCVCILLFAMQSNQSPYDYLKKNEGSSKATSVNELLYQTKIGNKIYAVFFINEKNSASCAIIKKTFFSYSILEFSTEVLILNDSKNADFLFTSFNKGHSWIDWGIIRDDNIKQVLVNEKEAKLVDMDDYSFRLCYLLGDETEKIIPPEHELID